MIIELKCKRMKINDNGVRVEDKVVAISGEEWTLVEASQLRNRDGAVFTHKGETVTSLDQLPECPNAQEITSWSDYCESK